MWNLFGRAGSDNEDRSDTAMSRILWTVVFVFAVLVGGIVVALAASSEARAEGVTVYAGEQMRLRCTPPTTYADGTPLTGPVTVQFYATQAPPTVGEPLGNFDACDGTVSTAGMSTGQWYAYATASQGGRPVSGLSQSTPFWLAPALEVAPGSPTDLVVERIPATAAQP